MTTIVEPKKHIDDLWGKQRIKEDAKYRLMKYVLRVDHEGKVLLHNVVTGRLVVLDEAEVEALETLPATYRPEMESLVTEHYLVPEGSDEHQQVVGLRRVHWLLEETNAKKGIVSYTILPTTACNARCYYCFEQGCKTETMSESIANQLVEFISKNCDNDRKVFITWFGGEPTVASKRIDQICAGLQEKGVEYSSSMITNGYLFDKEMVMKAKSLWHLRYLQICVDGTEESYNRVKAYVGVRDNPYQRIMRNIELLLNSRIAVGLRMNYDLDNYQEFYDLCDEVYKRFGENEYLLVAAHSITGEYRNPDGVIHHGNDEWFTDMQILLNQHARKCGLLRGDKPLPYLGARACGACKDSTAVITPTGGIVKCPEQFDDGQIIGNILTGIDNERLVNEWKVVAEYPMCADCVLFPVCTRLENCSNKTYCHTWKSFKQQYHQTMSKAYLAYRRGGRFNGIQGAKGGVCPD